MIDEDDQTFSVRGLRRALFSPVADPLRRPLLSLSNDIYNSQKARPHDFATLLRSLNPSFYSQWQTHNHYQIKQ